MIKTVHIHSVAVFTVEFPVKIQKMNLRNVSKEDKTCKSVID